MTRSPHISQIQVPHPQWARGRFGIRKEDAASDPGDVDTVSIDADAGDRPTSSLEILRARGVSPAARAEPPATHPQIKHSDGSVRDIGPGSVLRGRYLIEKAIGVGGSSTVFSALDRHRCSARANGHGSEQGNRLNGFGRIALKVLRAEAGGNDARVFRMEREFRQMQRLTHTGVVRVFDLDCEDNLWFITMELLEGQPLHRYLRTGLAGTEAIRILSQCAEALAYAHDQGIVHGDLKPSNVFITQDGAVRLFDFGSAPDLSEGAAEPAASHRFAATPPYASPETLEGKGVEQRDDIFSLGCLAYELLSGGRHPFERKSSLDARQQGMRPQSVDSIRPQHFAVIAKALAWERADRPAGAREFLRALTAADSRPDPANAASVHLDLPNAPEPAASQTSDEAPYAPPTAEIPAEAVVAAQTNIAASDAAIESAAAFHPPTEATKPAGEQHAATAAAATESAAGQPSMAEPLPVADEDDPPARQFAGFVPDEMLPKPKQAPKPKPAVDLHVSGLSRTSTRVKRTFLMALLAAVLAAGFFVLDRQSPTKAEAPTSLPVVSEAEAATAEPMPVPVPLVEEKAPVEVPPPTAAAIPSAPGEVSFESATVNVSASQSMAVVNIARLKSTHGSAPVVWSTVGGTAQPGVHYESVDSKVARFNDGQSVRSLFIKLKNDPADIRHPPRSFVVKLEKAAGGPALGSITQARVIVEGME